MKKLLSVLLATATVFSTTAFASPAAEPIESADEISLEVGREAISSKISDASLAEETASYYDPTLGVRLIGENFEGWKDTDKLFPTKNASGQYIQNTITYNGLGYTLEGATTSADIVRDEENGNALQVNIDGSTQWPSLRVNFGANTVKVPAKFTMSAQYKYADAEFAAKAALRPAMRLGSAGSSSLPSFNGYNITDKNRADVWLSYDKKPTFTLDNLETNHDARALQFVFDLPADKPKGTILVDNINLYYKPTNQVEYKVVKAVYPTVIVSAPDGIEKNAATALTAEPQKYFGKFVNSCAVDGNTITLTVNGAGNVSLPSVVNADKTKTYTSVDVTVTKVDALAPLYGINLIDENFESFTVGETYNGEHDTKIHGNRVYATEGGKTSGVLVENVDGVGSGKYIKLNIDGSTGYPVFRTVLDNGKNASTGNRVEEYVRVPAKFTASIKMYFEGADFAKAVATRPALRKTDGQFDNIGTTNFGAGAWNTLTKTYSQTASGKTVRELMWIFEDTSKTAGTMYIDDIKLYYKPIAKDSYSDISFDFPTITVTAKNGFEANALAAMEVNPAEYLSSAVKSVEFADNKMIITLNEDEAVNYSHITIPELVNGTETATYPETKIDLPDYYAPVYGLRNYLWNAGNKSVENTDIEKNPDYFKSYSFNRSAEGFDYISLVTGAYQYPHSLKRLRDTSLPYDTAHTYTYITKSRFSGVTSCMLRRVDESANSYNKVDIGKKPDNTWNEIKFEDYTIEAGHTIQPAQPDLYVGSSVYSAGKGITADVAYIGLYYRPKATSSDYTTKFSGNTVTVTYANGIDKDTAEALETYYGKYFGGNVTALTVNGNDVVMTLKDGVTEVTVPKLVNADGSATYDEVIVNTAVAPASLAEETTIRATYPAGLRFKAAVKSKFMEDKSLTEFGYIVARADKLSGAELTANMTSVKTIVSPSFKKVDGEVTINKYEVGTDNTTFAAVLVNIPNTNYGDKFAVRPYVVYGGEYYYGDTMKASILEVAESLKDGATGDVLEVVNKIIKGEALPEYKG